jgi:diacylglycerol kinase
VTSKRPEDLSLLGWVANRLGFAFNGLFSFLNESTIRWVHLPSVAIVVVAGVLLKIEGVEWCLVILAIALVFATEALNSALESLADAVHPSHHPLVGRAKDVAAGAVLIASFAAAAVGLIVLLPRFWALWR